MHVDPPWMNSNSQSSFVIACSCRREVARSQKLSENTRTASLTVWALAFLVGCACALASKTAKTSCVSSTPQPWLSAYRTKGMITSESNIILKLRGDSGSPWNIDLVLLITLPAGIPGNLTTPLLLLTSRMYAAVINLGTPRDSKARTLAQ